MALGAGRNEHSATPAILTPGNQFQMLWVAAVADAAKMINHQMIRDISTKLVIGNAVNEVLAPENMNLPISITIGLASPYPATALVHIDI